jgi:hypothetical protein
LDARNRAKKRKLAELKFSALTIADACERENSDLNNY